MKNKKINCFKTQLKQTTTTKPNKQMYMLQVGHWVLGLFMLLCCFVFFYSVLFLDQPLSQATQVWWLPCTVSDSRAQVLELKCLGPVSSSSANLPCLFEQVISHFELWSHEEEFGVPHHVVRDQPNQHHFGEVCLASHPWAPPPLLPTLKHASPVGLWNLYF